MTPQEQIAFKQQKDFDIELRKELNSPFPVEFIPRDFRDEAAIALQHQSLPSLRVDFETYGRIMYFIEGTMGDITYYEISFLINCVSSSTPHQLRDACRSYLEIQRDANDLSLKWNSLVNPIKERVQRKLKAHIILGLSIIKD